MHAHARPVLIAFAMVFFAAGCASIKPPRNVPPRAVSLKTTAYCSCKKCCNWRYKWIFFAPVVASGPSKGKPKDVGVTASGVRAHDGTIAADTKYFPFGTVMYVPGFGYGRVEDRGSAIKGYHIDLWFDDHDDAMAWGVHQLKVKVWMR
jgi:3D (Asp-Asp-Asp) domain-containing protein